MRLRSLSILATSTFFALLGCPLDEMSAPSDSEGRAAAASGSIADNTESHDDRVDAAGDVTWADSEVGAGRSALRVLMTDAPLDADNVFVTICGIHVHSLGPIESGTSGADPRDPRDPRGSAGAGAGGAPSEPRPSGEGRAEPGAAGAGGAGAERAGAGGDGSGEPAPEPGDDDAQKAPYEAAAASSGGAGGLPSDEAPSGEAGADGADRDEADAAASDEEQVDDTDGAGERPIGDERDPAQAPRPDEQAPPRDEDSSGDWLAVSEQCQTLDLLTLRDGVTEAVGVASLPPGRYGQIRLLIAEASVVVHGLEQPLTIPSGSESGVKINGGFALFDGEATTILLDFDAGRSVHYEPGTGYMMTPVIQLIDVADHAAAPAGGDRGGAEPGVAGAAGRDGAGSGSGGAEALPGDARPRPEMPGDDPARRDEPRPEDEPLPPEGGAGGDGAGGSAGADDGALPPDEEEQ